MPPGRPRKAQVERSICRPGLRCASDSGFGLLDLVVGITIGVVMVGGISRAMTSALGASRTTRTTVQSSLLASERLEEVRGIGWGDALGHLSGSLSSAPEVVSGRFDPDGSGGLASETVVENANGQLANHARNAVYQGITFHTKVFITAANTSRRATAIVEWSEQGRVRATRASTLISPLPTKIIGGSSSGGGSISAAAYAISGTLPSIGTITTLGSVHAPPDATDTVGSFTPAVEVVGSGAYTEARASGGVHRGRAQISSATFGLAGVTVAASAVVVQVASSAPGATPTMTASGSVTVNGQSYVNPSPNTVVTVGLWRIVLNEQRAEIDGSRTITYVRISGLQTEVTMAYAWARPS